MSSDTCLSDLVFSATLTPDKKKKVKRYTKFSVQLWVEES